MSIAEFRSLPRPQIEGLIDYLIGILDARDAPFEDLEEEEDCQSAPEDEPAFYGRRK